MLFFSVLNNLKVDYWYKYFKQQIFINKMLLLLVLHACHCGLAFLVRGCSIAPAADSRLPAPAAAACALSLLATLCGRTPPPRQQCPRHQ